MKLSRSHDLDGYQYTKWLKVEKVLKNYLRNDVVPKVPTIQKQCGS